MRPAFVLLLMLVSADGRSRPKETPVSLVLSYLHVQGRTGHGTTWVLDDRGRQFRLDDELGMYLGHAAASGLLSASSAAAAIQFALPVPGTRLSAVDVTHARALLAGAEGSTARTQHEERKCDDGSTDRVRGYVSSSGAAAQRVVPLLYAHCGASVDENLSPQAQELIAWAMFLDAQAAAPRSKDAPASLVLSCRDVEGRTGQSTTWLLDDRGRQFIVSGGGGNDGALEQAASSAGIVGPSEVATAIQSGRPISGRLTAADVDRARLLIAIANRSTARARQPRPTCNDASTHEIYGYFAPSPSGVQRAVLLSDSSCLTKVDENLSPQGQELIAWVNRLEAQPPAGP